MFTVVSDSKYVSVALNQVAAMPAGQGVPQDSRVADSLLQHAAAGGEPAAQREVGWRSALGLIPSQAHVFQFTEPDVPKWVPRLPRCESPYR